MSRKRYDNNIILCYGDLHLPYHDKRAFDFLAQVNDYYKPDRVIDMGDLADQYNFSRYPKDPTALSTTDELRLLRKGVKTLSSIFPKIDLLTSNHDNRLYSKATISGIPRELIVPYKEMVGAPDNWRWHKSITLTIDKTRDRVYFVHDPGSSVFNLAKSISMNTVAGHIHSAMGVQYFANPLKQMFAAQTGCFISDEGAPFEYNKKGIYRPLRGCIVIIDGVPEIVRMD